MLKEIQIEELPDLKVNWIESYKYLAEPLLEYVWEAVSYTHLTLPTNSLV